VKKLLRPAIALMNSLTYAYKFTLISILWLVPIIGLTYMLLSQLNSSISRAKNEVDGIKAYDFAYQLIIESQRYRDFRTVAKLRQVPKLDALSKKSKKAISATLAKLASTHFFFDKKGNLAKQIAILDKAWKKEVMEDSFMNNLEAQYKYYNEFVVKTVDLLATVMQVSGLSQDPSQDLQLLLNLSRNSILKTTNLLGYTRAVGMLALKDGMVSGPMSDSLNNLYDKLTAENAELGSAFKVVLSASPSIKKTLSPKVKGLTGVLINVRNYLDDNLITPMRLTKTWPAYEKMVSGVMSQFFTMNKQIIKVVSFRLSKRLVEKNKARFTLFLVLGIELSIIAYLYAGFSVSVRTTISNFSRAAQKVAAGDLTVRLSKDSRDEMGELTTEFNSMTDKMQELIQVVRSTISDVNLQATRVNDTAVANSEAVEKQMAETSQISEAMHQMVETVDEVASSSESTSDSARSADQEASQGRAVVDETMQAIEHLAAEISHSVERINRVKKDSEDINQVLVEIKGIAGQTNLLALNAAIEAARAGEQGRGFAVVADEVRTLSQRTQKSTEEIEAMIGRLQTGVQEAVFSMRSSHSTTDVTVEQSQKVQAALLKIVASVSTIVDMSNQIAGAAEEQAAVAKNIDNNVTQITEFGHETAANASDTLSASKELSSLTTSLQELIDSFQV